MKQRTLLIATTNKGKSVEIQERFKALNFNIIGLEDLKEPIEEPEEYGKTIEENALIKAKYYGDITGHLTIADDSGLYIDALDGWPGVVCARVADTDQARVELVLEKMKGITERSASFRVSLALYDPRSGHTQLIPGETALRIANAPDTTADMNWGYNPIIEVPELGKTYSKLTIDEKNEVSHRGKALRSMFFELESMTNHKNIPIGVSFVIQDNKLLMQLRNDPGNERFHKKWEFPGGGIDFGETMHEHIARETKEESGLEVEVVHHLQHVQIESHQGRRRPYQIILLAHICKVVGGSAKPCDEEVLELGWFDLDDVVNHDLVGNNVAYFTKVLPEIKDFLQNNPL